MVVGVLSVGVLDFGVLGVIRKTDVIAIRTLLCPARYPVRMSESHIQIL
jgi:hypothetical protein